MKKIMYNQFGSVEVLQMVDTAIPEPNESEMLVNVKAVSINPLDWKIREGKMKLMSGSRFPKATGLDFSGVVEKVGKSVRKFKPGDEVFGLVDVFKQGALAEYIVVQETQAALKAKAVSFEQAAATPIVGTAALQIFDQLVKLQAGTEVLVNGASGGTGMFAIQLAKRKGAIVTSVVSAKGIDLVRQWGSDLVINYQQENVLATKRQYDVVIDLSGKMPFRAAKRIMKPASVYVNTVPGPNQIIGSFLHNLFSRKKYKVLLLKPSPTSLATLATLVSEGMEVLVGATHPMASFREAYQKVAKEGGLGKSIITVG